MKKKRSFIGWIGFLVLILTGICMLAVVVSVVSNTTIPTQSASLDRLTADQKALLREATLLREALGNSVFPGFADQEIPFVVYNEQYAFYSGDAQPSPGWVMAPYDEVRGGEWEPVPDDDFYGQTYYRTAISDPGKTPESFVVQVEGQLAGSFQTREYGLINMAQTMRAELPPVIRSIVPYRLVAGQFFTKPTAYISGLLHESFHAYQGTVIPEKFTQSEMAGAGESNYPFEDDAVANAWKEELAVLSRAGQVENRTDARDLAAQFLALREQRRSLDAMSPAMVEYEQQREWLEGLAKYAELEIGRLAAHSTYTPHDRAVETTGLDDYADRDRFWRIQLESIDNTLYNGETIFYYSGFAQAVLLDQLMPGWKERAISDGKPLDALVQEAVNKSVSP